MPVSTMENDLADPEHTAVGNDVEESERIQMEELAFLANTFSGSAATVLQRGYQGDWIRLRELLLMMQPIGNALLQFHEVQHYVQRLSQFIEENNNVAAELKLPEILTSVFVDLDCIEPQQLYPSERLNDDVTEPKERKTKPQARKIVNNNPENLFSLNWKEIEEKLQPKQLSLTDIHKYLPRVLSEISRQEAIWNEGLGLTLIAANTDIPTEIKVFHRSTSIRSESTEQISTNLVVDEGAIRVPKTGLEVVEALVKSQSLELTRIWYLNLRESKKYNPYDLVVVSKNRLNPEHFVISVFGVLHVKPAGESELMSLGQWFREAIVFRTIQKVNYFKNFQICKALMLWKSNVNYLKFLKVRKQIKELHLLDVPCMMTGIVTIKSLLSEMQDVSLLPSDAASCYSLDQFNNAVFLILQNAKKYAVKLNSHCQKILAKVEKDCLEFLQYSEFQIEQKTSNIKESMTLARQRRSEQIKNLKVAKYIGRKLPCFVRLVEELLHQFMLVFISENIASFVHGVMGSNSIERKGLFSAAFDFDPESSLLVLSPSPEEFIRSLKVSFDNIPTVLSESCLPLTLDQARKRGSKCTKSEQEEGDQLTVDQLRVLLNCGPKEAHEVLKQGHGTGKAHTACDQDERESLMEIGYNSAGFLLEVRLAGDKVVQNCILLMQSLMRDAFAEVSEFAEDHKWIAVIHSFVKTWNQDTLESWKGQTASKIEKQVQQIRSWIDQIEAVEKSMMTSNGLLYVDGLHIQNIIVPGLQNIFVSMMDMISRNCLLSSEELIAELNETSKVLSARTSTIEEFASFYKTLKQCKKRAVALQNKEEYLKSIFEVVRHCYRQLTPDEEETEERLNSEWNSFLYVLQDANNKVNELMPQMLENLESSISSYEDEESDITDKVTSGKFLDASQDPKNVLPELKELHTRFLEVKEELLKLVKCKEIIEEVPHDLTSLSVMHSKIVARHELWKYCEVTAYTIRDWLQTPFAKLQVKKVIAKVTKWREASAKLKKDIPTNDEVLKSWIEKVEDFGIELPLLLELSTASLKPRHWKWLFAGLGQVYDQSYQYLVSDLVRFGIRENSQLVISICDSSATEFALESHLKKMIKRWEEEEFRLMRYYQERKNKEREMGNSIRTADKASLGGKLKSVKRGSSGDMFILTGVDELQAQVEDNLVTLQSMLVSPHLSEMRVQAEAWTGYLHQLKEILDTWISCQQKWLYLKKIFEKVSSSRLAEFRFEFDDIDVKYKEHMSAVLKDPKVLSVLAKKRGDRGYRELQGENLQKLLFQLITKQEMVIKSLDNYLDDIRASFPRLFFLSNSEMLELLAISQDPKALVPFVRKCFTGIVNLKFVLPAAVASTIRTQLDATLNAHLLEVVCLYGGCGEEMNLIAPVSPSKSVEKWFCKLEVAMKSILWNKMARCIEERLLYTPSFDGLLNSLGVVPKTQQSSEPSRPSSARMKLLVEEGENAYWYMVHPFQCVVAAEEVIWSTHLRNALEKRGFENLADVRKTVDANVEQFASALKSNVKLDNTKPLLRKLLVLVQTLLTRALYQRDVSKDLDRDGVTTESFEWLQCLKYQIEVSHDTRRRVHDRQGRAEVFYGAKNSAQFGMLSANQMGLKFPYGYEYQGPMHRLVITPLTGRALLNLSSALKLHYAAGLFGPTQSGKSETIQEVSKITGTQFVAFTCSPSLSLSRILHFISGAVQSGALICLENITSLPDGILSVLGQHLDGIRQAISALQKREFSQFEIRDPVVSKEASEETVTRRRRGITVISLHTLLVNESAAGPNTQEKDLQALRKERPRRRHSIHEIMDISDPRNTSNTDKGSVKGAKSEVILPKFDCDSYDETISEYKCMKPFGNINVAGSLMKASPLYGCLVTISPVKGKYHSIPDNLRNTIRMFGMIRPDYRIITEAWLILHGFKTTGKLSKKIVVFREMLRDQFLDDPVYTLSLAQIKTVIEMAGKGCRDLKGEQADLNSTVEAKIEEACVGQSFYSLVFSSVYPHDLQNFVRLLKVSFPQVKNSIEENGPEDQLLLLSVKQQIDADNLLDKEEFVHKVMQLHATMFLNRSVILLGESGSGKSACYQTLCRALCQFYSAWTKDVKKRRNQKNGVDEDPASEKSSFSKVHLSAFYHKATNNDELFGNFSELTQSWSDGLLSKLLRTATQLHDVKAHAEQDGEKSRDAIHYWFVFDGPLDSNFTGPLDSLLDDRQELCIVNGESIKPPASVRFLFETTTMSQASPALVARSAIVNFESKLVDWTCLFHSWKKTARNKLEISTKGFRVIEGMIEHINAPLAEFLCNDGDRLLANPLQNATSNAAIAADEVTSILQVLSALLERFLSREIAERRLRRDSVMNASDVESNASTTKIRDEIKLISSSFAYAFVWAVGGKLHERCYAKFDVFTRQTFATCPYSVIFPCSVFDCVVDPSSGELLRWHSAVDVPKPLPSQQYILSPEIEKCFSIADLLLSSGSNVLIVGERGVGKTSFAKNLIQQKHKMHRIVFTQGLTSQAFQKRVQTHIEEQHNRFRSNPLKSPPQQRSLNANKNLFFIDDIGMTSIDPTCDQSQSTLEVLRQMISEGGVFNYERKYFQHFPNLQFVGTYVPISDYGQIKFSHAASRRLTRRFNVVNMIEPKRDALVTVYTSVYKSWLEEFPAYSLTHIEPFAKALGRASVDVFYQIKEKFTSSPTNPHFVFSHHDLARIAKGVFIFSPRSRSKIRKAEKGLLEGTTSIVNKSLPDLKVCEPAVLPDASLSLSNLPTHIATIDRFPASVSPLIRTIIRLWCHEVCRCFQDRMIDSKDQDVFSTILNNTVMEDFCGNVDQQENPLDAIQIISRESSNLEKKSSKSRVKFKDIESSKAIDYAGPLITFQHLLGKGTALTDIKFTKHLFVYGSLGVEGTGEHDKGYAECQNEHVEEALRKSLNTNTLSDSKQDDLVLYKDAMQHAIRISRTLALPGGHALLVSVNGHGRANITRIVARLASIKVMTVSGAALSSQSLFRSIVKDASFVAGLQGRPVVLFIHEGLCKEGLEDVASLMVEGTCPDLYSKEELTAIGNHLLPGGQVGQRRTESKIVAQDRFLRRIMSNLHIVLCAWHGSMNDIVARYPNILTRIACVDTYCEWTVDILKEVAERWLVAKGKNEFFYKVLWDMENRDRQLRAIYRAMAHFHLSARNSLDKEFKNLGLDIFSPLKFIELVEVFRTLCNAICQTNEESLARLTTATNRVQEARKYVENVESSIGKLTPLLEAARSELKAAENKVKAATQEYHNSKQACVDQQNEVEKLKLPIQVLKQEAKEEFGKLTPVYEAALAALKSLDIHDVEEIRSYRDPPLGVKFVADMICLMFEKPANWEDAKLLLMRDNFFQDLVFYDKDKISDDLFRKLEKFSRSSESSPDYLLEISKAASSLSVWIRAVYNYCHVLHTFKPKQEEMKNAEKQLNQAKATLGEKRVHSHQMKAALENSIEIFKDQLKETKSLEKQLQSLQRGKAKADNLLDVMRAYTDHWEGRMSELRRSLRTAAGDALLAAATVCYLSAFEDGLRRKLREEWVGLCSQGLKTVDGLVQLPLNEKFSIVDILSSEDEQIEWRRKGAPSDVFSITNALCTRTCCLAAKKCWPLLIDPQEQGPKLIRHMEEGLSWEVRNPDPMLTENKKDPLKATVTRALVKGMLARDDLRNESPPRPNTKGNILETSTLSERVLSNRMGRGRLSTSSNTDDIESGNTGVTDQSESRASTQRPISSFSAITNESAFLSKFYTKTGLKEISDIPPPSPLIELTEDTLIVIDADAVDLDRTLKAAVVKGIPVLVTHVERGITSVFLASILGRTFSTSEDGISFVRQGNAKLECHPNFRLYLSAAVAMDFNLSNRLILPLHKALVINLAMSDEGLENRFTTLTIRSEKPELDSQRRSLRFDLFYLQQERRRIQESILNRVCNIPGKILDESSLSDALIESRSQLKTTDERLEEGLIFQDELEAKRQDYYQVAFHASMLHNVTSMIGKLEPFYEMPLYFFEAQLRRTLKEAKRRRAGSGAISARAAEVNEKFTFDLYKRVCLNVFKEHVPFYPLLAILEGHLKDELITSTHYQAFLNLCSTKDVVSSLEIPDWMDEDLRHRLSYIQDIEEFQGVVESFERHKSQWKEYFSMPPNLICSCPCGYEKLSLFSKALLWLAVLPSQRSAVIQNIIVNTLGPQFTEIVNHNLADVAKEALPSTPMVVLLPQESGNANEEDAALKIESLGRSLNAEVITVSFGVPSQLTEAARVLRDVKGASRKWVILENCHLVEHWSRDFLRLIEEITESDETADCSSKRSANEANRRLFRLWFIFKCKKDFKIPVAIWKKGLLVAWDEKIYGLKMQNGNLKTQTTDCSTSNLINNRELLNMRKSGGSPDENLTFYGLTAERRFQCEMSKHLGKRTLRHANLSSFTNRADSPTWLSYLPSESDKEEKTWPLMELIQQFGGEFQNSSKYLMKCCQLAVYENGGDEQGNNGYRDVLSQVESIHESLAKKTTSRLSKAVYQFFHREIKTLKEFCEKVMEFLRKAKGSTKKESSNVGVSMMEGQLRDYQRILDALPYNDWQEWLAGLGAIANALLSYIRPKSRQPLGFDVNMIPHLKGFFASIMEDFCLENFADIGKVHWEGKMLQESGELLPPLKGVYLKNLELHNADWSHDTEKLVSASKTEEQNQQSRGYILHLIPAKGNSNEEVVCIPVKSTLSTGKGDTVYITMKSSLSQEFVVQNSIHFVNNV